MALEALEKHNEGGKLSHKVLALIAVTILTVLKITLDIFMVMPIYLIPRL